MMIEPMMLILAFFIFFFFAFTYVRLDFSISKDEGQEVRLKVAGFCEKICALQVSNFWHNVKVNFNIKNHPKSCSTILAYSKIFLFNKCIEI